MWRRWLCGRWLVPRLRDQPAAERSDGFTDLDQDAAILIDLLADYEALLPCLQLRLLNRVHLEEPIEMRLRSPAPLEVVVPDCAHPCVDHSGILPAGELNQQASRFAAVELRRALDRLGESQPAARGCESSRVLYAGLDLNYVRHRVRCSFLIKGNR